jgi:HTH-type transcriptional regulator/antitoxin HipB
MHRNLDQVQRVAEEIGALARAERERLGLRQDELATMAGVSTRVVHQIETGKPTSRIDSLIPVLDVLGLTLEARGDGPGAGRGLGEQ